MLASQTTLHMKLNPIITLTIGLIVCAGSLAQAALPGMKVVKLYSPSSAPAKRQFGFSVAINEKYAVVGERAFDLSVTGGGAVHVFDAVNGKLLRTLKAPNPVNWDGFGSSLALRGKLLLVGSNSELQTKGGCYLFDVSTGKLLRQFEGEVIGDHFGATVALTDELMYMAAPYANNLRGSVRVEGITSTFSQTIGADLSGFSQDYLGRAIHTYGNHVAISKATGEVVFYKKATPTGMTVFNSSGFGSVLAGNGFKMISSMPDYDLPFGDAGAVCLFSFLDNMVVERKVDPTPATNRKVGRLLATEGNLLVSSAEVGAAGTTLLLHNLASASTFGEIKPQDLGTNAAHSALALSSGRLLVGSWKDTTLGSDAGAAYLIQTLPQPESFVTLATKGGSAPGAPNLFFNQLGDATNGYHDIAVTRASLSGSGSNGGRDTGIYSEIGHAGWFDCAVRSRQVYGGSLNFGSFGSPVFNDLTFAIFPATITGPSITSASNDGIFGDNGTSITTVIREGWALQGSPQTKIIAIRQAGQAYFNSRVAARVDLKQGEGNTTASNDTAIVLQTHFGVTMESVREGADLGMGLKVGQINPRTAYHADAYFITASITNTNNPAEKKNGIMRKMPGGNLEILHLSGWSVPSVPEITYSTFIGEGGTNTNRAMRVTIKGTGITAANNEMVLFDRGMGLETMAQKNGSIIGRILRIWPMGNRMLMHTTLRGTGFNSSNNEALWLCQEDGSFSRVLQKGNPLPGIPGARIGRIQRVEVSNRPSHYAVLASITGVPSTSNQILMRGNVEAGTASNMDLDSLRRPVPVLRKGTSFHNGFTGSARLTSMSFASNATADATGVSQKGLASVVGGSGTILMRATFSDGSTRLIRVP